MPARLRAWIDVSWVLIAAVVFALITYGTGKHTLNAWINIEFIPGYIIWPAWLSHLPIPLGCALITLRLVHHAIVLIIKGADSAIDDHREPVE